MSDAADDSDGAESQRKRIRQACLNCRRKKVRCGGERPNCTFCSRLSQTCIYVEDGRSQRRSSMSYSGLDDSTEAVLEAVNSRFSSLEHRFSRIESALERLGPLLSGVVAIPGSQGPPSPAQFQASPQHQPEHQPGQLLAQQSPPNIPQSVPGTPTTTCEVPLPPIHTLLFAADVYFRFCHNQPYSLFHEPTFRSRLVSGTLPAHLVWALLSAARRYSTLPYLYLKSEDDAMVYARRAWECLKLPWNGSVNDEEVIPVIQTIVLIVNTEHPAGHCGSAYMKLGFALRMALHSKLHMEPETDLSPIFREERKRTFWSLYLEDKLISLSRERFATLSDEECKVKLPCSEPAFREGRGEDAPVLASFTGDCLDQEAVDTCCPLALITVMASTLSRVSHYVLQETRCSQLGLPWSLSSPYAAISSTLVQLEHYFGSTEDLKESLIRRCFVDGAVDQHLAGSFIYSKALFHLSHCLLHHPFLLQQRLQKLKQKPPPTFIKSAWEKCRAHAKSLTDLKDIKNHNVVILTSLYGYCTMVAGTIHVLSMNDEDASVREEGKNHYLAALEFLRELSCYWKHAALMVNRLERFRLQYENRRQELDPCTPSGHSPHDVKALWQSVDYALLSTPTRPGSPTSGTQSSGVEYFTSPSRLFDFADFGMFAEGVEALGTLPLFEGSLALTMEGLGQHHTVPDVPEV
ncbi:fungal-specific transcription factor domain-containing protein [Ilyonectria destructans]|nr:fungal-specific transcription factor domain-containing protein [Ilyonectria destructans]